MKKFGCIKQVPWSILNQTNTYLKVMEKICFVFKKISEEKSKEQHFHNKQKRACNVCSRNVCRKFCRRQKISLAKEKPVTFRPWKYCDSKNVHSSTIHEANQNHLSIPKGYEDMLFCDICEVWMKNWTQHLKNLKQTEKLGKLAL